MCPHEKHDAMKTDAGCGEYAMIGLSKWKDIAGLLTWGVKCAECC